MIKDMRYAEFINIWIKDVSGDEAVTIDEKLPDFKDGCYLADRKVHGKSSCMKCPFSDCVLSEALCADGDEGFRDKCLEGLKDRLNYGGSVLCCNCYRWLNKSDEVYRLCSDTHGRWWCAECCALEVSCLLMLRLIVGNWVMRVRRYERVWKPDLSGIR